MAEIFVEAALNGSDGSQQAYFFLGDHYVTYDFAGDRVINGVRPVSDFGVPATFTPPPAADASPEPAGLDAAVKGRASFAAFGYLFKGTDYVRARLDPPRFDGTGALSVWRLPGAAFTSGIDAAFNGRLSREGKGYFFRGGEYNRYDWVDDRPDTHDPNGIAYPRLIANMVGMPVPFTSGVDAALDGDAAFADVGYLFRRKQYLRFLWVNAGVGEPHVDGPAKDIHRAWPGLVELLLAGKGKTKALVWVRAAQAALVAAAAGTALPVVNAALATHFHIDPALPQAAKAPLLTQIQIGYANVTATLESSATVFRFRTDDEASNVDHITPIPPGYTTLSGHMNFTESFAEMRRMARAAIVLHEAVHHTDAESGLTLPGDVLVNDIPEWYVTDTQAAVLGLPMQPNHPQLANRYDLLMAAQAVHNPSAYAAFAQHVAIGSDTRFGAVNQGPE